MNDQPRAAEVGRPVASSNSLLRHALLCAASFVMLYPLLWMLASSLKPESEIFHSMSLWPSQIDLGSYVRGWFGLRYSFGTFFMNSAVIAVLAVIGNVLSCSLAAFAFA